MAKKRFTDGLGSLFGEEEQSSAKTLSLFPKSEKGSAQRDEEKRSSKGFASQLDAFLAEAFEAEEKAETEKEETKNTKSTTKKRSRRKRLSGLDLLIRQTTDTPPSERTDRNELRRLTLAFDNKQLDRLRAIAKEEGVFLKDLISKLIERYLAEQK